MKKNILPATFVLLLIATGCKTGFAAEFREIYFRIGGYGWNSEHPKNLSGNGRILVGSTNDAIKLDLDTNQTTIIGLLPGDTDSSPWGRALAASADGSVIVGNSYTNDSCFLLNCEQQYMGFAWRDGQFTNLPWISGEDQAHPLDVTDDGSMAVGYSYNRNATVIGPYNYYRTAVTWDTTTGAIRELGVYGDDDDSWATAVSGDGSVIVGQSGLLRGMEAADETWWQPVVWRDGFGWYQLGKIFYGSYTPHQARFGNIVRGLSNDGKIAAGNLFDGAEIVPVRWNTDDTDPGFRDATQLPLLIGTTSGAANDASNYIPNRGYVIAGQSGSQATLWETEYPFAIKVENYLQTLGLGNAIAGWTLWEVLQISDDAKAIAGTGESPNGKAMSWYADLRYPQPNETREKAQYIGQSPGNLFTHRVASNGSTVDATASITPVPNEEGRLRPTVWYSYSAEQDGYLTLDLAETIFYPLIAVYRGNEQTPFAWTWTCSESGNAGPCFVADELKIDANVMYYISISGMEIPQGNDPFTLYHQFTPISDQCDEAFFLEQTLPYQVTGSTNDSLFEPAPSCSSVSVDTPGVWFKVIGTGGYMTASLDGAVNYDSKLSVYCGGCATQNCVAANDDIAGSNNRASRVGWCSNPGTVYHVLVHGYGGETGNFTLTIDEDPGFTCLPGVAVSCSPLNDTCDNPVPLEENKTLTGDNTDATTSGIGASCYTSNSDVWYSYTTRCGGSVLIDTVQPEGSLNDTVLSVYDSCGGNELGCNDDEPGFGLRSVIDMPVLPAQELFIRVAEAGTDVAQGSFPLRVQEVPDDIFVDGGPLPDVTQNEFVNIQLPITGGCPNPHTNPGLGYFISAAGLPPGLSIDQNGILYGTATTSGHFVFDVTAGDGEIYTAGDSAQFSITVLPGNDNCARRATPISEGLILFGNFGATQDGPSGPVGCSFGSIEGDIWYSYSSSCTGFASISLCGSEFDTQLEVYPGNTCPQESESALACNDNNEAACGAGTGASQASLPVSSGEEYLIRVGGYEADEGNGRLLVTCFDDCNGNAVNDLEDIDNNTSTDCNGNNVPDECEIQNLASEFGRTNCSDTPQCLADFNGDDDVDGDDLSNFIECRATAQP